MQYPLNEDLSIQDLTLYDSLLFVNQQSMLSYSNNPWTYKTFMNFLLKDSLETHPTLNKVQQLIKAQRRLIVSRKRSFWMPTIAAQTDVADNYAEGGQGIYPRRAYDDLDWSVGLKVSIPLFEGGRKLSEYRQDRTILDKLNKVLLLTKNKIEENILTSARTARASFTSISLSEKAAEAAKKNLNLVKDAYSQGTVSIIDLLDAQNAAFVSDEVAANSVYDFLIDYMVTQRAMGKFYFLMGDEEKVAWSKRMNAALDENKR